MSLNNSYTPSLTIQIYNRAFGIDNKLIKTKCHFVVHFLCNFESTKSVIQIKKSKN